MSAACAHFPLSSHVRSFSLKRWVTGVFRGENAKLCHPYHGKVLLHRSHNICPAATQLAPNRKANDQREPPPIQGHRSPHLSPSLATSMHPPALSEPFPPCSSSSHLHTWLPWGQEPSVAQPPYCWNSLPRDIQHFTSITTFKSHLKIHLFRQVLKSVASPDLEWPCSFLCVWHHRSLKIVFMASKARWSVLKRDSLNVKTSEFNNTQRLQHQYLSCFLKKLL